jgi:hypothetical protein
VVTGASQAAKTQGPHRLPWWIRAPWRIRHNEPPDPPPSPDPPPHCGTAEVRVRCGRRRARCDAPRKGRLKGVVVTREKVSPGSGEMPAKGPRAGNALSEESRARGVRNPSRAREAWRKAQDGKAAASLSARIAKPGLIGRSSNAVLSRSAERRIGVSIGRANTRPQARRACPETSR